MQALDQLRVVEIGPGVAISFAGKLFADFGADVIKVEDTGAGDYARSMGEVKGEGATAMSDFFVVINRNKRAVSLNLKAPAGLKAFLRILDTCDVFVTNVRPGLKHNWSHTALVCMRRGGKTDRTCTDDRDRPYCAHLFLP